MDWLTFVILFDHAVNKYTNHWLTDWLTELTEYLQANECTYLIMEDLSDKGDVRNMMGCERLTKAQLEQVTDWVTDWFTDWPTD